MRKSWFLILLLIAVLLSACNQQTASPTLVPATETPATTGDVEPTAVPSGPATCKPYSLLDQILPSDAESKYPAVKDTDWAQGNADAALTLIVYSDLQCPYCSMLDPVMNQLIKDYPKDVRFVFRHFPLSGHDKSTIAAQAAEAAGKQGKFWEMKDVIFAGQSDWSAKTVAEFETWVSDQAKTLGLDVEKFKTDMKSDEIVKKIKAATDEATKLELPGTPFVIANGVQFQENPSYEVFSAVITLIKMKDKQFTECPPTTIDAAKKYTATIKTDKGNIVAELYPDKAPLAVNSFIFLAKKGWFDGTTFHRVIADFVAQAGDPSNSGAGGPGYAFGNEISADLKFDAPGMLGMANAGPDSNGSQFFITYAALPNLDGNYTIFGKVTEGMDVAKKLTERDASKGGELPDGDKILSVTIEEK